MTILERIAAHKKREIGLKKSLIPEERLREAPLFQRPGVSLRASLEKRPFGIIAEHKRRSPSRAVINQSVALPDVVEGYDRGGAGGISVLTDSTFFGGSLEDLVLARACTQLPLLRKEFILDPYQITEAKAHGADAILLIAALLEPGEINTLSQAARDLGMEVLLEVHDMEELLKCPAGSADLMGVNNRNLKTFEVSLETSRALAEHIPAGVLRVSESGLGTASDITGLKKIGYHGFLMGESFMKNEDPGAALASLLKNLQEG